MKLDTLFSTTAAKADRPKLMASLLREAATKFAYHPSTASLTWVETKYKTITEAKNVYAVFVHSVEDQQWRPHASYISEYDAVKTLISLRRKGEHAAKIVVEASASDWRVARNVDAAIRLLESKN